MADLDLRNVQDIANSDAFDSDLSVLLSQAGRFRDIAAATLRQLLSTSLIKSGAADPGESEKIANTTVFYIQTTDETLHVSLAGGNWITVGGGRPADPLTGAGIVSLLAALTGTDRLSYDALKDLPTIPAALDGAGIVSLLTGLAGNNRLSYTALRNLPTIPAALDGAGIVSLLSALTGNSRLPATAVRDLPAGSGGGLATVATDETLQGDGTSSSPLGVVGDASVGEIGRILSIGSYTLGTSTTPASANAGYATNTLYIHTTAADGDKSTILAGLSRGDYIHIATDAILEVTAAPTLASSVYTLAVTVLEGTVPTSGSHTLYYIKENRALIAGAVHGFNIANGGVALAHLAAEVLTNWLSAVATDSSLEGDGTSGSALGIAEGGVQASHLDDQAIKANGPTPLGNWRRDGSNGNNAGSFQVFRSNGPVQMYINATNADGSNRQTELLSLRSGDKLLVAGTVLTLTGTPTGSSAISVHGTWPEDTIPSTSSGQTYAIINISREILATNLRVADTFLGVDADLNLIWRTPQAGQQDEGDSEDAAEVDINSGLYTTLGTWERDSTSIPDTGKYYTQADSVTLNGTDADGTARNDPIEELDIGDRLQFGTINAFVLSSQASPINGWSMDGAWVKTWNAGDFDGETTIYVIKKNNIVVRKNVVPDYFLKINDALEIVAHDPAESLTTEILWEGGLNPDNPGSTDTQMLNAGKKFSDYKLLFFRLRGFSRPTWEVVHTSVFAATTDYVELESRNAALALQWISDTQFVLSSSAGTGIILQKVVGMKGL